MELLQIWNLQEPVLINLYNLQEADMAEEFKLGPDEAVVLRMKKVGYGEGFQLPHIRMRERVFGCAAAVCAAINPPILWPKTETLSGSRALR